MKRRLVPTALLVTAAMFPAGAFAGPEDDAMYTLTVYRMDGTSVTTRAPFMAPVPIDSNFDGIPDRTISVAGVPWPEALRGISLGGEAAQVLHRAGEAVAPVVMAVRDKLNELALERHVPREVWQQVPDEAPPIGSVEALVMTVAGMAPPVDRPGVRGFRPHGVSVTVAGAAGWISFGYEMFEEYETLQLRAVRTRTSATESATTLNVDVTGAVPVPYVVLTGGVSAGSVVTKAELHFIFAGDELTRSATVTLKQAGPTTTLSILSSAVTVWQSLDRTAPGETVSLRLNLPGFPGEVTFVHGGSSSATTVQLLSAGFFEARVDGDVANSDGTFEFHAVLRNLPPSVTVVLSPSSGTASVLPSGGEVGSVEINLSKNEPLPYESMSALDPTLANKDYTVVRQWSADRWIVGAKVRSLQYADVRWKDGPNADGLRVDLRHQGGPMIVRHYDYGALRYTDVTFHSLPSSVVATVHGSTEPKHIELTSATTPIGRVDGTIDERREWRALHFDARSVPKSVTLKISGDGSHLDMTASDAGIGTLDLETKTPPTIPWLGNGVLGPDDGVFRQHGGGASADEHRLVARVRSLRRADIKLKDGPKQDGLRLELKHAGGLMRVRNNDFPANRFVDVTFDTLPTEIIATIHGSTDPKVIGIAGNASIGRVEGTVDERHEWKAIHFVAKEVPKSVTLKLSGDGDQFDLDTGNVGIGTLEFEMKSPPTAPWIGLGKLGPNDGIMIMKNGGIDGPPGENRTIARLRGLKKLLWYQTTRTDPGEYRACTYTKKTSVLKLRLTTPGNPLKVDFRERLEGKDGYLVVDVPNLPSEADLTASGISQECAGSTSATTRALEVDYAADVQSSSLTLDTNEGANNYYSRVTIAPLSAKTSFCKSMDAYCYSGLDVRRLQGSMRYSGDVDATVNADICMKDDTCPDRVEVKDLVLRNLKTEIDVNDVGTGTVLVDTKGTRLHGNLIVTEKKQRTVDLRIPSPGIAADNRYVHLLATARDCYAGHECPGTMSCPASTNLGIYAGIFWLNLRDTVCTATF